MKNPIQHIGQRGPKVLDKLTNEEYSKVLDNIVITCVDVIVMYIDEVLLIKRKIDPRKDHWWYIGGRMLPGESPIETANRKLRDEAGIISDSSKFIYLNTYSTHFNYREQEPKENGSHTVNITYIYNTYKSSGKNISLSKFEFQEFKWIPLDEISRFLNEENEDEYIRMTMNDLLNLNK